MAISKRFLPDHDRPGEEAESARAIRVDLEGGVVGEHQHGPPVVLGGAGDFMAVGEALGVAHDDGLPLDPVRGGEGAGDHEPIDGRSPRLAQDADDLAADRPRAGQPSRSLLQAGARRPGSCARPRRRARARSRRVPAWRGRRSGATSRPGRAR